MVITGKRLPKGSRLRKLGREYIEVVCIDCGSKFHTDTGQLKCDKCKKY